MPADINNLTEGWLELESDPGLFTLLLEDFGVPGIQVEEIYDLQKPIEGQVYGFIFLFRWNEDRRARRLNVDQTECFVKDENVVNNMFFAEQVVPDSCATHALLSVLLNCSTLQLGSTLSRLKMHTRGMSPNNKGYAIGNTPELARAHNSHAAPQARRRLEKSASATSAGRFSGETFHFVSYVPVDGKLYELDGLKPFPIDHGPWKDGEDWTEHFRAVISERLGIATGGEPYHDIRFNLMAVVPDRRILFSNKLKILKTNRQIVLDALEQLLKLEQKQQRENADGDAHSPSEVTSIEVKAEVSSEVVFDSVHMDTEELLIDSVSEMEGTEDESKDVIAVVDPSPQLLQDDPSGGADENLSTTDKSEFDCGTENGDASPRLKGEDVNAGSSAFLGPPLPDYTTPLTIQTSPAPSSSSTDTSSEVGSAFNSPNIGSQWTPEQGSPSPGRDIRKLVVVRVSNDSAPESHSKDARSSQSPGGVKRQLEFPDFSSEPHEDAKKACSSRTDVECVEPIPATPSLLERQVENKLEAAATSVAPEPKLGVSGDSKLVSKYPELREPHKFAPKDLLALLKNLDREISSCEAHIRDENEKRRKYKIDDSRRAHNYDEFICTFLIMLAKQGKLADLVQQNLTAKKKLGPMPPPPMPKIPKPVKKPEAKSKGRRKRGRPKHKRRR